MSDHIPNIKGFYLNKPLQLADRLESMGFYLDREGAAVIRHQHAEIERLRDELRQSSIDHTRAEIEALRAERDALRTELAENEATISVWRGHTERAAAERDVAREALLEALRRPTPIDAAKEDKT